MNCRLSLSQFCLRASKPITHVILICLLLTGCAGQSMNETAYSYTYNEQLLKDQPLKFLIATRNFGIPSKSYLQKYERDVDTVVIEQLEDAGHTIVDNKVFETAWRRAIRKNGSPYDASGASIIPSSFKRVVAQVFEAVKQETDADIILFTDLIEPLVVFSGNSNRRAKWHGVSRSPRIKGGNQLAVSFDWTQTVPASSLRIIAYSREGELILKNIGGLEVVKQLDTQRERFIRRDTLFTNSKNLKQGVRIALHPIIPFEQ